MVTTNMDGEKPALKFRQGLVKFVNSGDSITLITDSKTRTECNFIFSNIQAPKLARRPKPPGEVTSDEPFAWDAREYLRQKIIGKIVYYQTEKEEGRLYGTIFYPEKENSITKLLIEEGWVSVRSSNPELKKAEEDAKSRGKGIHNTEVKPPIRDIKWDPEPKLLLEKFGKKVVRAVIENINSTFVMRAFILPDHYYVAFCFSGIKLGRDQDEYHAEVKQFLEEKILQRDVKIILESVQNEKNRILNATLIHEARNQNIGELLVSEGFASCNTLLAGVHDDQKLRAAEKKAQNEKKRKWKNFVPKKPPKERPATVLEVINGDALIIRYNDDVIKKEEKKIFLSSIKPPRAEQIIENKPGVRSKLLYDTPWLYEAREFLRTRLIGKKVNVSEDYVQPARDKYPEKICCSVLIGQENIAEALVSKGLATCVRYREDEENKSPHYEKLRQAEEKAEKSGVGVFTTKKDSIPIHRVNDVSTDPARAKAMFPSLQRTSSIEGVVEFVASGSRFRIYIDRETCLITFLLGGIECPRASRPDPSKPGERIPGEEFGEEALNHVKEKVLQRTVEIKVETMDKRGGMIGWMFVNNVNLSVDLVEKGYARVHETADRSIYARALKQAEEKARDLKLGRWANYKEEDDVKLKEKEEDIEVRSDRKINYVEHMVAVVSATDDLSIYAQKVSEASKIDSLMARLHQEFSANPPVIGAYNPKRSDICAAKFSADQQWYRAKVEKVQGRKANIYYIDYGNRETVEFNETTYLPESFKSEPAYAHEYKLAFVKLPPEDYKAESVQRLEEELENKKVLINVEYAKEAPYVTVYDLDKQDIVKGLIAQGYFFADHRRDRRLQKLIDEYKSAEDEALKNRLNIWEYGDIRGDDDDQRF